MDLQLIFTVCTLHLLALMVPGPDFLLTLRNSLHYGQRFGLASALGFGAGIGIHVFSSIAGLALVIKTIPEIYSFLRVAGALYLIWLGTSTLAPLFFRREGRAPVEVSGLPTGSGSMKGCFLQALLTNLLNPKATLFILGLFTTVVPLQTPILTRLVAGLLMVILTVAWFLFVAVIFGSEAIRRRYLHIEKFLNFVFGVFFLVTGALLVRSEWATLQGIF